MFDYSIEEVVYATRNAALLGLDITESFWVDIGLGIGQPDRLRAVLRELILRYAFEFRRPDPKELREILDSFYERLRADFGEKTQSTFRTWAIEVLSFRPADDLARLKRVLHAWFGSIRNGRPGAFHFGVYQVQLYEQFAAIAEPNDILLRIDAVKLRPLSAWDEAVYNLVGFNNDPELVERVNNRWDDHMPALLQYPLGTIFDAAVRNRFRTFWEGVLQVVDSAALEKVRIEAERHWAQPLSAPIDKVRSFKWD